MFIVFVLSLGAIALDCAGAAQHPSTPTITAEGWPAADALFHRDPRWLGADAAYSIPLGRDRTLWLFGDTFVATSGANVRQESKMVRNTVAVQTGLDPSSAQIGFYWRTIGGKPASFLPEDGDRWFWPLHGMRIDRSIVLFVARLRSTPGKGLGFEGDGWRVAIIDEADNDPSTWVPRIVDVPPLIPGVVVGQSVLRQGDFVVALAVREPGDHAGFLVRWPAQDLAGGRLGGATVWTGQARGWERAADMKGDVAQIMDDAGPEASLHFDDRLKRFVHVKSLGFGATTIAVAFADHIEGPWSAPRSVFRPAESNQKNAFVYAGKAHPELRTPGGGLAVTYTANTLAGFDHLRDDITIYFPRFVVLHIEP